MTYFKYVERSAEDNINWAEIGKNMSDMLQQEAAAREAKKAQLDTDSREYGERLSNSPSGTYDGANTFISEYADAQQQYRLLQDRLFQSGQLNLRDYTRNRQNSVDGTDIMFDLAKEYEAEFVDKMERYKLKKSSYQEVFKMEQAEGLANLREVGAYINPTNGVVNIGKKVTTGTGQSATTTLSKNPNDVVTVPQLRNRIKQKIDRMDIGKYATNAADQLGAIESSVVDYASKGNLNTILTEINATKGSYGVEGDAFAAGYLEWEKNIIGEALVNPNDAASILVDTNTVEPTTGKPYTFSDEPNASKRKANEIYLNPTKGATGDGTPDFTKEQTQAAEDVMKVRIRGAIDQKVSIKGAGFTPKDNTTDVAVGKTESNQEAIVTNFAKLWYGDAAIKEDAADSIRAYNPDVESVSLSDDGESVVITFTDKSGLPPETLSFGDDQESFIESGMNFILSEKDKIGDINEVIKRGGINVKKPKLSGKKYMFESMGDVTTTLPFEEAYKLREGAKIDVVAISDLAKTTIDDEGENEAVTVVQTMVNDITGIDAEDVTVRDFYSMASGRGIVVTIKGQDDMYINLDKPTEVTKQVEAIRDAIVNYAVKNVSMLPEDKEKYAQDYGQVRKGKPMGSAKPAASGAGSAPRKKK